MNRLQNPLCLSCWPRECEEAYIIVQARTDQIHDPGVMARQEYCGLDATSRYAPTLNLETSTSIDICKTPENQSSCPSACHVLSSPTWSLRQACSRLGSRQVTNSCTEANLLRLRRPQAHFYGKSPISLSM